MTFTFTIRIARIFFVSAGVPNGEFPEILMQNVGQDFFVLDFFHGRTILKVDGRDPQNGEKNAPAGRFTSMRLPLLFWH